MGFCLNPTVSFADPQSKSYFFNESLTFFALHSPVGIPPPFDLILPDVSCKLL